MRDDFVKIVHPQGLMPAAVFAGEGEVRLEMRPIPQIARPDEVLLRVISCGLCGSDLQALAVPPGQFFRPGVIMGHEIYAEVARVGDGVMSVQPGDRVAVDPIPKCGVCKFCRGGKPNMCQNWKTEHYGQQKDGGFAPFVLVRESCLYKFKTPVRGDVGAQTEPLACVMNGMKKLNPSPLDRVVLFGAGPVGLLFLRALRAYGVRDLILCEKNEYRRTYAKGCGADDTAADADEARAIMDAKWDGLATIVVDAVGIGATLESGLPLLEETGRYLIFGQNEKARGQIAPAYINTSELQILGSFIGKYSYEDAIRMLELPGFEAWRNVSHRMELSEIEEAVSLAREKKAARIVLYPNGLEADDI